MNKKIKKAVSEMGLAGKEVYTIKEMEAIAEQAGCQLIDVMWWLRHVR